MPGGSTGDRQSASKPPGKANHVPQQHGHTCTQPKYYFSYQTTCSLRRCSNQGVLGSQGGPLELQKASWGGIGHVLVSREQIHIRHSNVNEHIFNKKPRKLHGISPQPRVIVHLATAGHGQLIWAHQKALQTTCGKQKVGVRAVSRHELSHDFSTHGSR